ncbi:hypothetical protein MRX96_006411 [Rhipicephalus microplus]
MEPERRGDDGDSGEASPTFRRVGSRTRSRSFNNSTAAAASSSPSRKEECGGSRSPRAVACGTTTKKAYSLESIQRCKRWRPCQLLREVFAKTPLLFGARRQPHKATTSSMAPETLSSEDSGHAESPVSLVSVVIETPPSPPGVGGDPPSKSRRSCSADSAVDFDTGDEALLVSPLGGDGDGGGSDNGGDVSANGVVLVDNSSVVDRHCTVLVDGGTVVLDGNSLHQPPHPQHQLHRTSLPGDRSKRPPVPVSVPLVSRAERSQRRGERLQQLRRLAGDHRRGGRRPLVRGRTSRLPLAGRTLVQLVLALVDGVQRLVGRRGVAERRQRSRLGVLVEGE